MRSDICDLQKNGCFQMCSRSKVHSAKRLPLEADGRVLKCLLTQMAASAAQKTFVSGGPMTATGR